MGVTQIEAMVPAELLTLALEAIERAECELETLDDWTVCPIEYDPSVWQMAKEHAAMAEVIRRIARSAPPDRKRRLGQMCRAELAVGFGSDLPDLRVPVDGDVQRLLSEAVETIRRRATSDGRVRDALREVQPWAW